MLKVPQVSSAVSHTPAGTGPGSSLSPPWPTEHALPRRRAAWPGWTVLLPDCLYPAGADETCTEGHTNTSLNVNVRTNPKNFYCEQHWWRQMWMFFRGGLRLTEVSCNELWLSEVSYSSGILENLLKYQFFCLFWYCHGSVCFLGLRETALSSLS